MTCSVNCLENEMRTIVSLGKIQLQSNFCLRAVVDQVIFQFIVFD